MPHIIHNLLQPLAILMLYVLLFSLSGYVWPGYRDRATAGYAMPLLWFLLAVLALIAWVLLVFYQ